MKKIKHSQKRTEAAGRGRPSKSNRTPPNAPRRKPARRRAPARRAAERAIRPIVVRGDKVTAATRLMAETLPLAGYTNVLADCPGKRRPHLIRGMRADHRPNVICQGGFRYVLMDVVFPGEMNLPDVASRWQLFSSAAEQAGGEFHVIVPRWVEGVGPGRDAVAKAAEAIGVRIAHVWEI